MFGFIFASVAGYMAGLVGSSNNPISGVTIATVIVSALILLQIMGNEGPAATLGPIAVIFLAGLICSAAAIAGDNMQDLKCGHVVGATPWRQQIFQVVGVVAAVPAGSKNGVSTKTIGGNTRQGSQQQKRPYRKEGAPANKRQRHS